jgi:hypothetical protein
MVQRWIGLRRGWDRGWLGLCCFSGGSSGGSILSGEGIKLRAEGLEVCG